MKKIYSRNWSCDGVDSYRCVECKDTGRIRAFDPKAMRDAVEHVRGQRELSQVRIVVCDVPCMCEVGDVRALELHRILKKIHGESAKAPIRTDDERVIKCDPVWHVDYARSVLVDWAKDYQGRLDDRAAAREAPYAAFEAFNSGVDFGP